MPDPSKVEFIHSEMEWIMGSEILVKGRTFDLDHVIAAMREQRPEDAVIYDATFDEEGRAIALQYLQDRYAPAHIGKNTTIFKPWRK